MLRAALQAQVEIGLDEMIVGAIPTLAPPAEPVTSDSVASDESWTDELAVRRSAGPATLFGGDESATAEPQYESLEGHRAAICECQNCPLGQTRTKFVYGVGNPDADLMFVGEAPGRDEDLKGEPFVGAAGKLLDKILKAMGLARDQVYIANILKCRPPNNRDPQPEEMAECFPYLREQIRLIRPKYLVALGRIAGQALLDTKTPLGRLRGRWHEFEGIPLLVTYHPAALLRFAAYKKDTWEDMKLVMAKLGLPVPTK